MSIQRIRDLVTSKATRQVLLTQKHSPKILFAAGSLGVIAATVLACRATLKLDEVLEQIEEQTEKARSLHARVNDEAYSEEDLKKDLIKIRVKAGVDIAKLYAPSIIIGASAIGALTGSHVILSKRNGAVMAAYAGVDRAYKEYRQRVVDQYGRDVDRKFATGAVNVTVEEKTSEGTTKTVDTTKIQKDGKYGGSPYAAVFDEKSKFFSTEPGRNAMTIQMKQNWANDKLRAQGHLFLNEVYDMLGLPRTKAGAVVGWVWRRDNEPKNGDNFVDFGVFDGEPEWVESFIDGAEKYVVLDFNVDGMILDLI